MTKYSLTSILNAICYLLKFGGFLILLDILWPIILNVVGISLTELDYSTHSSFNIILVWVTFLPFLFAQIYDFYLIYVTNKKIKATLNDDCEEHDEYVKENLSNIYKTNGIIAIMKLLGFCASLFIYGGFVMLVIYIGLKINVFLKYRNIKKVSYLAN